MLIYLAILLALAVFFSALLTPAVYMLLLQIWPEMHWPFSRVLDRVFLLALVLLIFAFRRRLQVSEIFQSLSWPGALKAVQRLFLGVLLAFITAWGVTLAMAESGALVAKDLGLIDIFLRVLKVLPAALLIAVIEEVFFRLLLLRGLRRALPVLAAVVVTSIVYAMIHFVAPDKSFAFEVGNFWQGFSYTVVVTKNALQVDLLAPMFGLFLVGLLLAYIAVRQKSLILCIGLHAGWILALKLNKSLFNIVEVLPNHTLAARYYLVGQPLVWLSFIFILLVILILAKTKFFSPVELKW